jgi:8-oxo-dGTP diphosphatase
MREALEETGLKVKLQRLVGVYSDPKRDPRGHVVSACFLAKRAGGRLKAASDVEEVKIFKRIPWRGLAFDHARILKDAGVR